METKRKVRQARAAETRKRIVAAAKKLITENGFENVSIENIAKEAEVSTGSFYTYFKKKEDVVEELNQLSFYHLIARRPLPQFTSSTVDRSELRSLRVNREGMNCLRMYLPYL